MTLASPIDSLCPLSFLAAVAFGFLLGSRGDSGPSPYVARENAVLAARYYSNIRSGHRLPIVPRGIFYSSLFLTILLLRGFCPELRSLFWLPLVCALSSGASLLSTSNLQSTAEEERKLRIEQFISDPSSSVPEPVAETRPLSLTVWHRFNLGFFLLMLAGLILLARIT